MLKYGTWVRKSSSVCLRGSSLITVNVLFWDFFNIFNWQQMHLQRKRESWNYLLFEMNLQPCQGPGPCSAALGPFPRPHGPGPHVNLLRDQALPLWCRSRASPANATLPMEVSSAWNWGCPGTPRLPYSVLWNNWSMPCCKRKITVTDSPATSTPDHWEQQDGEWHRSGLIQTNWVS